jgi:CRP/FNR family transcriptional regulator
MLGIYLRQGGSAPRPGETLAGRNGMIDKATRERVLERFPMLQSLPAAEFDGLMSSATYVKAPAGGVMFDEGEPCRGIPLLLSGKVAW